MSALTVEAAEIYEARPRVALRAAEAPAEAEVAAAEAALARHAYSDALELIDELPVSRSAYPALALRALLVELTARMELGELDEAVSVLDRAHALSQGPAFTDRDRADVVFRAGCCRLKLGDVAEAASQLTLALDLCNRSGLPCDDLRSEIHGWRSRCHQRNRNWDAARLDVECSVELAEAAGDGLVLAHARFQASIVAERGGQWLVARMYAEEALELYRAAGDERNAHRVLNNLGGINFLLGSGERGLTCLKEAFTLALECGDEVGAGYAMSSLAQIQLGEGEAEQAEVHARRALELLGTRPDHDSEVGNAHLVLGRALAEQSHHDEAESSFRAADSSFELYGSLSHRAAVWVAQGDLAAKRGACEASAALYRRAAEALQDFRF